MTGTAAGRAKVPLRTHCPRGHLMIPENIYQRPGRRECRACKKLRKRREKERPSEQKIRRMINAIDEGATRRDVKFILNSWSSLNWFLRAHPRLASKLVPKLEANRLASHRRRPQCQKRIIAPAAIRNAGHDSFEAIQAATRHLLEPMRGAIQSDLWLDVAEERLKLRDIPEAVRAAVTRYNRAEKYSVMSRWGNKSLDAKIGDSDSFTLLDTIADAGEWSPIAISEGRHVTAKGRF